ncbi:MAG TPA: hypothetical protein VG871_08980 [Vicinamibacterales bacterium]|nr:hypothetical protein [Vicinamibacterales bacterium]
MSRVVIRSVSAVGLVAAMAMFGAPALQAQRAGIQPGGESRLATAPAEMDRRDVQELRNDFREVMRHYSPALGQVLKLDPTLLTNPSYLQGYPALAAFLSSHPEVARSPQFFLSDVRTADDRADFYETTSGRAMRMLKDIVQMFAVLAGIATIAFLLGWLVRHLLAHRRWLRATKLQMDIHNRLMERLSSSADVQAYLESAATNRLLSDVPLMPEAGSAISAPVSRILWSIQIGIVVVAAGVGLMIGRHYLPVEAADVLVLPGIVAVAIGIGFTLASAASYILSSRLGLLPSSSVPSAGRNRA